MQIIFADDPPYTGGQRSIFLVGPTPRDAAVPSWRPIAIDILEKLGFNGAVLVPERRDWKVAFSYANQADWEYSGLAWAKVIACWVPRDMQHMLALTTNVEFGYWISRTPERILYGRPFGAPHTRYLDWLYHKSSDEILRNTPFLMEVPPIYDSLESLLQSAVEKAKQ